MLMQIRKSLNNQKGFTLVELLAVVAILGVLAAIAIPRFQNATDTANTSAVAADLRAIDTAIVMFQANTGQEPAIIDALVTGRQLTAVPRGLRNGDRLFVAPNTLPGTAGRLIALTGNANYLIARDGNGQLRGVLTGGGLTGVVAEQVHR